MTTFPLQLKEVQRQGQDFEWYPTTDEIIATLVRSLKQSIPTPAHWRDRVNVSFLDIGAGNGKVLKAIAGVDRINRLFAIEKSQVLLDLLPASVMVLGVDFWNTSLVDKEVNIIFSNPPYSEYESWVEKILRECPSQTTVYLVIPDRWEKSLQIQSALGDRKLKPEILGTYEFQSSEDRKARARVNLIKIKFPSYSKDPADPFTTFFDATFSYPPEEEEPEEPEASPEEENLGRKLNPIESLCASHDARILELQQNYRDICKIPAALLHEFGITRSGLQESLRQKLATTKSTYWRCLFSELETIRKRLTYKSAESMRELLARETGIEFNRANVYAVVGWVIKNANSYFDKQLVETYESLIEFANVENYKSNKRIFKDDRFGYAAVNDKDSGISHYRLKVGHRMVLERVGGLSPKYYSFDKGELSERCANFISDLLTVANNLGFNTVEERPTAGDWKDSKPRVYTFKEAGKKPESLFRIRTFINNNVHIQIHPEFVSALNIQHGKLKGWLRNDTEAEVELDLPAGTAAKWFGNVGHIELKSLPLLLGA